MSSKILLPQLISMLAVSSGTTKKQSELFLKTFFANLSDALEQNESVKIKGIGTFKVIRIEARKSVDVSSGSDVQIPAHYRVVFSPSKSLAEKINKEFAWLDVVEISDNVSNGELDAVEFNQHVVSLRERGEELLADVREEELPSEEPIDSLSEADPMLNKADSIDTPNPTIVVIREVHTGDPSYEIVPDERINTLSDVGEEEIAEETISNSQTEGEELGEELEHDFGMPEPVEPFGPIDPDDPAPGEPITQSSSDINQDFDPYAIDIPEPSTDEIPAEVFYISKEEYENLATKEHIKSLNRRIKKVKALTDKNEDKNKKRNIYTLLWSIFINLVIITGAFILFYFIIGDKLNQYYKEQQNSVKFSAENVDDEYQPASVSGLSQSVDETVEAPADNVSVSNEPVMEGSHEANDIKATDEVTSTRYLTTMAKEYYGNYNFWPYIYLENEANLGHPDKIKPGTKVIIPNIAKYDVDPNNPQDIEKARKLGVDIYKRFSN